MFEEAIRGRPPLKPELAAKSQRLGCDGHAPWLCDDRARERRNCCWSDPSRGAGMAIRSRRGRLRRMPELLVERISVLPAARSDSHAFARAAAVAWPRHLPRIRHAMDVRPAFQAVGRSWTDCCRRVPSSDTRPVDRAPLRAADEGDRRRTPSQPHLLGSRRRAGGSCSSAWTMIGRSSLERRAPQECASPTRQDPAAPIPIHR